MLSELYFIGDKFSADRFKDEITPSIKENDRVKISHDVALNHVRYKGKPICKISCKVLKEEYGYDPLLDIYPYPAFIQSKYYLYGINHSVTVVGKWIFDGNFPFALPLTKYDLE